MKGVSNKSTLRHNHISLSEGPRAHLLRSPTVCSSKRKVAAKAAPLAQEQKQYTVRLESLGCPKNVVDGIFYVPYVLQSQLLGSRFRVSVDDSKVGCSFQVKYY